MWRKRRQIIDVLFSFWANTPAYAINMGVILAIQHILCQLWHKMTGLFMKLVKIFVWLLSRQAGSTGSKVLPPSNWFQLYSPHTSVRVFIPVYDTQVWFGTKSVDTSQGITVLEPSRPPPPTHTQRQRVIRWSLVNRTMCNTYRHRLVARGILSHCRPPPPPHKQSDQATWPRVILTVTDLSLEVFLVTADPPPPTNRVIRRHDPV